MGVEGDKQMRDLSMRVVWLVGCAGFAISTAEAAVVSLKAVKRNDTVITPTNTVGGVNPGDTITAEVFISGWNANVAGSQLRTYQYVVDGRNGFVRGEGEAQEFVALPCGFDLANPPRFCETNEDCIETAPICNTKYGLCHFPCAPNPEPVMMVNDPCDVLPDTTPCPEALPCCNQSAECIGTEHNPALFTKIDIAHSNPDYVFKDFQPLAAQSFRNYADVAQGGTTLSGLGPVDNGQAFYAGTICIELLENACGIITVPFIDDQMGLDTFMDLSPGGLIFPTVQSLVINTTVPSCGTTPEIVSEMPENCSVDARAPHTSSNTTALGETVFKLQFDSNMEAVPNNQFVLSFVPPIMVAPPIFSSIVKAGSEVTFTLNRPTPTTTGAAAVPTPRWTCITFTAGVPMHNRRCWGHFPGDVDEDLVFNGADFDDLVMAMNDPPPPLIRCDINYSGACRAPDLVDWIDMANGGGSFGMWLNTTMPACPSENE